MDIDQAEQLKDSLRQEFEAKLEALRKEHREDLRRLEDKVNNLAKDMGYCQGWMRMAEPQAQTLRQQLDSLQLLLIREGLRRQNQTSASAEKVTSAKGQPASGE